MPAGTRPPRAERGFWILRSGIGGRLLAALGGLALLPLAVAVAGIIAGADGALLVAGGCGTLLALGVTTLLINGRFLRRLSELRDASGRLTSGELDAAVPAEGADELTEVAGALEAFRLNALALGRKDQVIREQRRAVERLERDLDLVRNVAAHDLKTPLGTIDGLLDLLCEDLDDVLAAESRRHLDLLQARVTRLDALIDALIDYLRAGGARAPQEAVDLRELVDAAIGLACPADEQVLMNGSFGRVSTWREPLERIVCDLLANACAQNDATRGLVSIDCDLEGRTLHLLVADNGPGIAPQCREHMFAPLAQFRRHDCDCRSGSGLAVVTKLLDSYGGSIDLRADPAAGRGSAIAVRWPIDAVLTPTPIQGEGRNLLAPSLRPSDRL